jgi:DNA polymerase-3 subunit delta'
MSSADLNPAFASLLGQDRAVAVLSRLIRSDRLPPAYLFSGPDGVGKRHAARLFASALNCDERRACGLCAACREEAFGEGYREITVAALLSDESIKNKAAAFRAEIASHSSARSATRFIIVLDGAERLTDVMQAALLKAIEEPAARTHYILVAGSESELMRTIRSRCVRLRFGALEKESLAVLARRAGITDGSALDELIAMCGGSWDRLRRLAERRLDAAGLLRLFTEASFSGKRHDLTSELALLLPAAKALRPQWREPLLDFENAIAANAHIELASAVLRARLTAKPSP